MSRFFAFILFVAFSPIWAFASSTGGGTTRAVAIDGVINQGAANGTNGGSWENDEKSTTSTGGVSFFYTWDDTYLYVGWEGGLASQQHIIYIDSDPANPVGGGSGSTSGPNYGGFTQTLQYTANFFANIQNTYNEYRNWNGSSWPGGTTGAITVAVSGDNVEARIAWSFLTGGRPSFIYITTFINDPGSGGCGGSGFQYAFAPSSARTNSCGNAAGTISNWYYSQVIAGQAPTGSAGSVPVELTRFTAKALAESVLLEWETATERNNDRFEIERSFDLQQWAVLDAVASRNGNAVHTQSYQYIDRHAAPGANYYRLRQVDRDGGFQYSGIVGVLFSNQAAATVWPNPVREDAIRVQVTDDFDALQIRLWDAYGRLQFDQTHSEVSKSSVLQIPVYQKGVYWLQLNDQSLVRVVKM